MRKILFSILAVLFMAGLANAATIPVMSDPGNFPEIWTMQVYNNSSSALATGTVVIWDCGNSATSVDYEDRLPYVTTTTTADHVRVAGVSTEAISASGGIGDICIYGPIPTLIADATDTVTVDKLVGTTTVSGNAGDFTTASDSGYLGILITDSGVGRDSVHMPVFVNPGNDG